MRIGLMLILKIFLKLDNYLNPLKNLNKILILNNNSS